MSTAADGALVREAAAAIDDAYAELGRRVAALTRRARENFERADWHAMQRDHGLRLDAYGDCLRESLARLADVLGERATDRPTWTRVRAEFARRLSGRGDVELAETFFNSVTRRLFHTIGVDPAVEFVSSESVAPAYGPPWSLTVTFERAGAPLDRLVRRTLEHFAFAPGWTDLEDDAARTARAIRGQVGALQVRAIELAAEVFFRGKGAYLVGKLHTDGPSLPLVVALHRGEPGVFVDAVLLSEDEVSVVFSFARSYFFVHAERPRELVDFLRSIMPRKPLADLYSAIGHGKHAKTELYRTLLHHLAASDDRFEIAPGQRGMVMCVFTLPGFDVVFKVIRDRFDFPKTVTHAEVREKYRLVFRHDRAGRLVDAQEFEHLEFARSRFDPALLEELAKTAAESVEIHDGRVVIRHLYTERRLQPLDLYLREADGEGARDAVIDYGQVLRDLAATNIFPGDMLLKNFGVSRHGRLIFYDYDELCPLDECVFRRLPAPSGDDEERAGEPWFFVGEKDIFPEEFRSFLGLRGELLQVFLAHHEELLDIAFWHQMQERHRAGEVLDIYPYKSSRRLRPRA